jgi:hypothetical protein
MKEFKGGREEGKAVIMEGNGLMQGMRWWATDGGGERGEMG